MNMTDQARDVLAWFNDGFTLDANNVVVDRRYQDITSPLRVLYKPIPEDSTQPIIKPRSVIHHSNSGPTYTRWQSLWNYVNRIDITGEPHAQVDIDGFIIQYMRFNRRADNNYKANSWLYQGQLFGALSWETADHGQATINTEGWTLEQLASIIALDVIACVVFDIPCTPCPTWTSGGLDSHAKFPEWSIYKGKTCPGVQRQRQMPFVLQAVADRVAQIHQVLGTSCPVAT